MPANTGMTLLNMLVLVSREAKTEGYFVVKSTGAQAIDSTMKTYVLQRHKDVVNRALSRLVNERREWAVLEQVAEIVTNTDGDGPLNINGDAGRYRMPVAFGGRPRTNHLNIVDGTPRRIKIVTVQDYLDMKTIRPDESGQPEIAAFVRMEQSEPTHGHGFSGYEMKLYPAPSSVETLTFAYMACPEKMDHADDIFFFGSRYDEIVERAIKLEAAIEFETGNIQLHREEYAAALARAVEQDSADRPVTLGRLGRVNTGPDGDVNFDPQRAGYPSSITVGGTTIL